MTTAWRDAKYYINERGWTQHNYVDSSGSVCMAGAVCLAVTRGEECCPHCLDPDSIHREAFDRLFKTFENFTNQTMSSWNDRRGRVVEEVTHMLDVLHDWELGLESIDAES